MNVRVECYAGYRGEETPRRLLFSDRAVDLDVIDQWLSPEYRYFKVQAASGSTYILRHDAQGWEVVTYES